MLTPRKDDTVLTLAAGYGFCEAVDTLIRAGADMNKFCPETNRTPLMTATAKGYPETLKLLLKEGADVNLSNSDGHTALMQVSVRRSAFQRDGYIVKSFCCSKMLLRFGAKINMKNTRLQNTFQFLLGTHPSSVIPDIFRLSFVDVCRLLFAAGEILDGINDEKIPDCLKFKDFQRS